MQNPQLITESAALLRRNWGLETAGSDSWEALREALCAHLHEMLHRDFAGLVNAMYRLDVPEGRFRVALQAPSHAGIAAALADAVLDRERLRAEIRLRYSQSPPKTTDDEC